MQTCYVDPETRTIADLVSPGELHKGWTITRINVPAAHRGNKHGTTILLRILADADKENVTLYLEPQSSGPLDNEALIAWYKRHGFVLLRSGYMRRLPQEKG